MEMATVGTTSWNCSESKGALARLRHCGEFGICSSAAAAAPSAISQPLSAYVHAAGCSLHVGIQWTATHCCPEAPVEALGLRMLNDPLKPKKNQKKLRTFQDAEHCIV